MGTSIMMFMTPECELSANSSMNRVGIDEGLTTAAAVGSCSMITPLIQNDPGRP